MSITQGLFSDVLANAPGGSADWSKTLPMAGAVDWTKVNPFQVINPLTGYSYGATQPTQPTQAAQPEQPQLSEYQKWLAQQSKTYTSTDRGGGADAREPGWYETTTPAERAAFFAANPTLAAISRFGIEAFSKINPYGLAALQEKLSPGMRQGYLAETYGLAGDRMADINREADAYANDYQAGTGVNQGMSLADQYSSYGAGRAAAESYVSPSMGSAAGNGGMNDAETAGGPSYDTGAGVAEAHGGFSYGDTSQGVWG